MSTVLLVDDDYQNRWTLQLGLEGRGHQVILAENGRDALAKAAAHFPELVITDLQMPEMDGRELCRRLKCAPAFAGVPIIQLSAMPQPVDETCYWTVFLRKPASMDVLLDTVDTFIATRLTYARAVRPSTDHIAARWQAIDSRCWP
jgi:CheY-like chemotaxis protein